MEPSFSEVAVFGAGVRGMGYESGSHTLLLCDAVSLSLIRDSDGEILARYAARVGGLRVVERSCFVLHGPMVSCLALDRPEERPVLVSHLEGKGFARLLACPADASFIASSSCQTQVVLFLSSFFFRGLTFLPGVGCPARRQTAAKVDRGSCRLRHCSGRRWN